MWGIALIMSLICSLMYPFVVHRSRKSISSISTLQALGKKLSISRVFSVLNGGRIAKIKKAKGGFGVKITLKSPLRLSALINVQGEFYCNRDSVAINSERVAINKDSILKK